MKLRNLAIRRFLAILATGCVAASVHAAEQAPATRSASDKPGEAPGKDRIVQQLQLRDGAAPTRIRGQLAGRQYIDYQLHAGAGQRLAATLKGSHAAIYFNLLPPGSGDAAMAIGELLDNRYEGVLPDDGRYTLRVFLLRSAARREESGRFDLAVSLSGSPLKPLPARADAHVKGTRFHAVAVTQCEPPYSKARECDARVVRRGRDGTATVELQWDGDRKRRILFVSGTPISTDSPLEMTAKRHDLGWRVTLGGEEHFEIPHDFLTGG